MESDGGREETPLRTEGRRGRGREREREREREMVMMVMQIKNDEIVLTLKRDDMTIAVHGASH